MNFPPFGHHHHPRRDDDDEEEGPLRHRFPGGDNPAGVYPPPGVHHVSHDRGYDPPPPFSGYPAHHVSHETGPSYAPPPQFFGAADEPPPFAGGPVHHVSHEPSYPPQPPFFGAAVEHSRPPVQHVAHETPYGGAGDYGWEADRHHHRPGNHENVNRQPTVRIFSKAEENYSLSIGEGKVILAKKDPRDERQHWIKDLKYSTKVKDEEGFPAFALVNKATGEALKHSFGATHPVRLVPYNPNYPDESVLWSESKDLGDGFRCIRMVNNIRLNFDAFHGDEDHGGVHDGTILVLWEWLKGKNQRWKIVPY